MISITRRSTLGALLLFVAMGAASCDLFFGPSGPEAMYQDALQTVDTKWAVYEVTNEGGMTVVRVEVDENITFDQGKRASDAIQKAEPAFNGYVEFFNSEVGMVLRKVEITPAT